MCGPDYDSDIIFGSAIWVGHGCPKQTKLWLRMKSKKLQKRVPLFSSFLFDCDILRYQRQSHVYERLKGKIVVFTFQQQKFKS